jgi:uncharacterized Zn finger protein
MSEPRWSARWRALLDEDTPRGALSAGRGRAYARSGRVTELRAPPGRLEARVQGSRATPYLVELGVPVLDDAEWDLVVAAVAGQVRHAARLLANQAPDALVGELEAHGVRLFPHPAEIAPSCSCDDPSPWCKHVAAVVEVSADRLDGDPFLLLRLRGRGRERLLADLARARRSHQPDPDSQPLAALGEAGSWTAAPAPLPPAAAQADARPPIEERGDPPGWAGGVAAADLFGPLLDAGAAWARDLTARASRPPEAGRP